MKGILIAFIFASIFIPSVVSADVYGETFDIGTDWNDTIFDTFTGSVADISLESYCVSLPNCVRGTSAGGTQRAGLELEPITNGSMSVQAMHTNTSASQTGIGYARETGITTNAFSIFINSSEQVILQSWTGTEHVFAGTVTINEWYALVLEWRVNGDGLIEISGGVAGVGMLENSGWIETTLTMADIGTTSYAYIVTGSSFSRSSVIDNFFINTDYEEPVGNTFLKIDNPLEGGNTASTTFDISFTYTLDDRVAGAENFDYIKFTACSRFYQNEPCKTESYETSYGVDNMDTITMTTDWSGWSYLVASFWNGVEEDVTCPWWNFTCQEEEVLIGASDSINFNIATTTIDADVPDWILDGDFCGAMESDIGNGFCQALAFMFYPSDIAGESMKEIRSIMAQKQPFGFFFLVSERMDELFKTEGAAGTGLTINLGESWGTWEVFNFATAREEVIAMGLYTDDTETVMLVMIYVMLIGYWWFRLTGRNEDSGANTVGRGI